ncbi:sensor histidine kinase [Flavobacterium sp.]|uniref:sensor histidine kinase n=1 Tax=Flavobacterium sp. TaxID=239 RepID=UPI002B4AF5FA|nr:ATP-binding protein [Flavobacterium sp.]HLF51447.1 ATP-binding protein [Flavobacterium sp.]
MKSILRHTEPKSQYLISILSVTIVTLLCLLIRNVVEYKVVGYLLLVVVSLLAIFLDILPVLLAAVLSALCLDFLFIQPYYTLHIESAEDTLLLLLFFIIALINGVLTNKIRKIEREMQFKEAKVKTMQLYKTLLDSLSHELRTPIATIIGSIGTLQQKSVHLSEDNKSKLLSEMEKASMRLNHQVENLLNMSRLESGYIQPKLDWCDLKELTYKVFDSLSEELKFHKTVVIADDNLALFKLDYGLMEQIIYNLVYNASLYTPKGATIEVKIKHQMDLDFEYHEDKKMTCVITVSDDGNGFPEDEIDKVFDKFYRLQHSKTGGTGLGLSIVKGFVEAQKGKITLKNKEKGGAIFKLSFPAKTMNTKNIGNE